MINPKNGFKFRSVWLTLIVACMVLLYTGCARTVTSRDTTLTLKFTLEFRENVNPSQTSYYIVFSSTSTDPELPDVINPIYFLTPGRTYKENNEDILAEDSEAIYVQGLYDDYFDTWTEYLVLYDANSVEHYQSLSTAYDSTTTDNYIYADPFIGYHDTVFNATRSISGKTLTITFDIDELQDQPNTFRFKIFTTTITDGTQAGYITDVITEDLEIEAFSGAENTFIQSSNEDINGSADIVKGWVEIY